MSDLSTVNEQAVRKDIRDFVIQNFLFGVDDANLTYSASFLETGIIDSTGILELVAHVEAQYGITVEDEEMLPQNLDSLANISNFVMKKRDR